MNRNTNGDTNRDMNTRSQSEASHLTPRLRDLHARALSVSRRHRELEWEIVQVLQAVERAKLHKHLGYSSLFTYCVQGLGFSEAVAYAFIAVARKGMEVGELNAALQGQRVSVFKAHRLVSVIDSTNAKELLDFAESHSTREVEREVARRNPKAVPNDQARDLSADRVGLRVCVTRTTYEMLLRAQSLEAQRTQAPATLDATLARALEFFLERKDPVRKDAARKARQSRVKVSVDASECNDPHKNKNERQSEATTQGKVFTCTESSPSGRSIDSVAMPSPEAPAPAPAEGPETLQTTVQQPSAPQPVQKPAIPRSNERLRATVAEREAALARDGGRCTHVDAQGRRCSEEKWLDVHHIRPVSAGGRHHLDNLTTLCRHHHDLVYQLSLPIEGQFSWLRAPQVEYHASILG
ncbi:MAG: HNH endonuclease [Bdellovibrionales bacterium]